METHAGTRKSAMEVQHQLLRAREFCLLGDYERGLPEFKSVLQDVKRQCASSNSLEVKQVSASIAGWRYPSVCTTR